MKKSKGVATPTSTRNEIAQKKHSQNAEKRIQHESMAHRRMTEDERPLVRRRHVAGIPMNDPNSVF